MNCSKTIDQCSAQLSQPFDHHHVIACQCTHFALPIAHGAIHKNIRFAFFLRRYFAAPEVLSGEAILLSSPFHQTASSIHPSLWLLHGDRALRAITIVQKLCYRGQWSSEKNIDLPRQLVDILLFSYFHIILFLM